jgi:hypothetical protein
MEGYNYIIGIGNTEDWEAGRGSLYYIEGNDGERYLPIFTKPEGASDYATTYLDDPAANLQMIEGGPLSHAGPLLSRHRIIMPFDVERIAKAAATIDAGYLLRNPRPGRAQEVLRLTKEKG